MLRIRIGVGFLLVFGSALAFRQPLRQQIPRNNPPQQARNPKSTSSVWARCSALRQSPPQLIPSPKLSDLAWLEGRWRADWGPRVAEQVWMAPKAGMMLGDFRVIENDKVLVIELFTLVEKSGSINFYFRHFTPELVPWEKSDGTLLKLATADAKRFDFENPTNGKPKRAIFTRIDADTYIARSEIIPETGDPQIIEITYHRQPLAAVASNSSAGAHAKKK